MRNTLSGNSCTSAHVLYLCSNVLKLLWRGKVWGRLWTAAFISVNQSATYQSARYRCMHAWIYTCKERRVWLLGIFELSAVRCTLLALCQARDQETWPPPKMRMLRENEGLVLTARSCTQESFSSFYCTWFSGGVKSCRHERLQQQLWEASTCKNKVLPSVLQCSKR